MEQLALCQGLSMLALFSSSRCGLFVDSCTYNWCIISNKPPSVCQITWLVVWTVSFSQIGLSPLLFRSNHLKGGGGLEGRILGRVRVLPTSFSKHDPPSNKFMLFSSLIFAKTQFKWDILVISTSWKINFN